MTAQELPTVKDLSGFTQTDFVPTLEHPLHDHKNTIYAPAFLYAWDKIVQQLPEAIEASDTNSPDFSLLIRSASHHDSLLETEYSADVKIADGMISAGAFFHVTLPYITRLQENDPILFDKTKVAAFGMQAFHDDMAKGCQILYYSGDDHVILKLQPENKEHEILLVKGIGNVPNLAEAWKVTSDLLQQGEKEREDPHQVWKYQIIRGDIFSIPVIQFNIETNYKALVGQQFSSFSIQRAYQRTGFILSENGAVVESEAAVSAAAGERVPVITNHKKIIFDEPFYVVVRRVDKVNPYFVMKVDNPELMMEL